MSETKQECSDLLARFGKGWGKGDVEALAGVFRPEAVFSPSPFDAPLRGQDAIRRYWKDLPHEQAEVSFRHGEVFTVGPWFATEFRCTFRRRRTGEAVDVRGALFCETEEGQISEMRMYWHRTVGGAA